MGSMKKGGGLLGFVSQKLRTGYTPKSPTLLKVP